MPRNKLLLPKMNDNRVKPANLDIEKVGKIHNAATNTLFINDIIDDWFGIAASDVKNSLSEMDEKQPLTVVIDSIGGSAYESIAIHNMISEWPEEVITHVSSIAASAAATIAMVGDKRTIADNAKFMIHNAWTHTAGNAKELRGVASILDRTSQNIAEMYQRSSNLSIDEVLELMEGEDGTDGTYLDATEATEAGFMTEVIDTSRKQSKGDVTNSVHPRRILAKLKLTALDITGR